MISGVRCAHTVVLGGGLSVSEFFFVKACATELMLMVSSVLEASVRPCAHWSADGAHLRVYAGSHTGPLRECVSLHVHHVLDARLGFTTGRCMCPCTLKSVSSTICVGACGPWGGHQSFPIMALLQNAVSLDPLCPVADRMMLFYKMPVLHSCPSLGWSPGLSCLFMQSIWLAVCVPRANNLSFLETAM